MRLFETNDDYYKKLKQELFNVPAHAVKGLPERLQNWLIDVRPELKEELEELERRQQERNTNQHYLTRLENITDEERGGTAKAISDAPLHVEEEPEDPSETVELRRWHLDRLRDSVHLIRQCLHNPHLEMESYYGPQPPLWLGRHNWALVPEAWVDLTTPDFSDEELWGKELWQLSQHLDESPFWNHLDELKQAAQDLNTDMDEAALKLGEHDSGFRRAWEEVRGSPSWTTRDSRTPLTPNPDWDTTSPPCGDGFTQKVCKAFADGPMTDIYHRLRDLVMKLDQLNEDLKPDAVEPLIINSTCDYCMKFS
ncbi:MAG: hypothetical protein GY845_02590 [Planctomycetes bacterium]|nr:hypothetical protein [Planctomycetota bacterium]